MKISNSEILEELSRRTGRPLPQLQVMFTDFYAALKDYVVNLEFYDRIRIKECFLIYLNVKAFLRTFVAATRYVGTHWGFPTARYRYLYKVHLKLKESGKYTSEQEEIAEACQRDYLPEGFWESTYESTGGGLYRSRRGSDEVRE